MSARILVVSIVCFCISYCDICHGTNIVAIGLNGIVRQTSDGGANWFIRDSGTPNTLQDIQCIGSTCWAVGNVSTIRKSIDAGITWSPLNSGASSVFFYDVQFLNKRNGWAVGSTDKLFTTSNGGTTWTSTTVPGASSFNGVCFVDPQKGWLVGNVGTIRRTIDGGQNWSFQTSGTTQTINAVQFLDENNGYYAAFGKVGHTTNGGSNWTDASPSTLAGRNVLDVQFLDAQHGFIVGSSGMAYKTDDGGVNWTELTTNIGGHVNDIAMLSPSVGAISAYGGSSGTVATTTDGGQTWIQQTIGPTDNLYAVAMFNVPPVGDYNGDNQVNSLDYEKWRSAFGSQSDPAADGNDDGTVNAADYVIWRNAPQSIGAAVAVPEPSTIALCIFSGTFIPFRRRRFARSK